MTTQTNPTDKATGYPSRQHKYRCGKFVIIQQGAFKGIPAQIAKQTWSTITGQNFPAYTLEFCNHDGIEVICTVREDWVSELDQPTVEAEHAALNAVAEIGAALTQCRYASETEAQIKAMNKALANLAAVRNS
jgi:hypothetical protein